MRLEIVDLDGELGVILPDRLVESLKLRNEGAQLSAEIENGGFRLMSCAPSVGRQEATGPATAQRSDE
jgi:antitoxin component of MazEF toxin-antitoxin module